MESDMNIGNSNSQTKPQLPILNGINDQPSTSGLSNIRNKSKVKKATGKTVKRKASNKSVIEIGEASPKQLRKQPKRTGVRRKNTEDNYSPPLTRNYAKLTSKELNNLAERIKIFHETGVVSPEQTDPKPCKTKKGKCKTKRTINNLGERIPGTHLGSGNIGANCSKFGVTKCGCCNDPEKTEVVQKIVQEAFASNAFSCFSYGITNCKCCSNLDTEITSADHLSASQLQPNDNFLIDSDESVSTDSFNNSVKSSKILSCENHSSISSADYLSVSQFQPNDDFVIDSDENVSKDGLDNSVKLPVLQLPKLKMIEKFLDSFAYDRVDYSKPEQKNIVDGLIHNPVSYYSEHLQDEFVPEKTILERIDFQKEQQRIARLTLLMNNPSTSASVPVTPSFNNTQFGATSTPIHTICPYGSTAWPFETKVPIISAKKPDNSCTTETHQIDTNAEISATEICVKNESLQNPDIVDRDSVLEIDRTFVTIRTPSKRRLLEPVVSGESDEDGIMLFVNDLMAGQEEDIVQECQERCQRLLESRQNTHEAYTRAMECIEVIDDEGLDNSVQIVEIPDDDVSNPSVQVVEDHQNTLSGSDSDIQVIEIPLTPGQQLQSYKYKKKRLLPKPKPTEICASDDETPTADNPDVKQEGFRDCSICLEPLRNAREISSTTCGHIYCTECIKGAIKTHKKCPICRSHLTLKKIHPLFLY